jgi:uncharacterized protein HemY
VWYVKREMYDQAIEYFERAAIVQPSEVKWRLMVASCYRRLGDFHRAFELYQKVWQMVLAERMRSYCCVIDRFMRST